MPERPKVKHPLFGRRLIQLKSSHPNTSITNTKPKQKQAPPTSSSTSSYNHHKNIKHLEILINETDLLPLTSTSLIDPARIYNTVLPFPNLQIVTLVMGMKRTTDVEELCLSQELGFLQKGLEEYLLEMRGRRGRRCGGCGGEVKWKTPVLCVQWLWPVEEEEGWLDLLKFYGIE